MNNVYRRMVQLYMLICIIVAIMVAISPIIYNIWLGSKANVDYIMTTIVAAYVLISAWDSLQVALINGIGCVTMQTYVTLIGLVLHIPLSIFIGKYIGALGVVTSMIIINIIYSSVFTTQIRKLLNGSARGIWIK